MQLQGGGGRRRGASPTDDNAADARAGPRDAGMIQTTGPRACDHPRPRDAVVTSTLAKRVVFSSSPAAVSGRRGSCAASSVG
ncbi:hypothetical protein E4U91_13160 [Streptomyces lasalocidi]|uniref:Uncharacterized protein n=1 Tax=Streptomyces lasalocidi TaxID=324833 RepID=A0A4V6AX37_STRLS|nr:hypothetical protein E4U91_13160 [Streptomyces lasalocidi]